MFYLSNFRNNNSDLIFKHVVDNLFLNSVVNNKYESHYTVKCKRRRILKCKNGEGKNTHQLKDCVKCVPNYKIH